MKNLVIVESPSKAKTIQKFLGDDFLVTSCMGHIRDLPSNDQAIDVANNFTPTYEISDDKKKIVAELKKQSLKAETVWLASDEDREGEAIAWHLAEALNLPSEKIKRIVFHEITKNAILAAVKSPRSIDTNLVDAQQARRILDRLVGFGLSPVLWRKISRNLSAGRVQSVAVRLVVEREREIQNHIQSSQFKITADFTVGDKSVTAELPHRFDTEEEARAFLEKCIGAEFTVVNMETKPSKKSSSAPFTTSTLQQEASRKLGYSLSRTMKLAQDLYEQGLITYMRTDSVNLSTLAIDAAKAEITSWYGPEYSSPKNYTTKVASAQEAHEAIRPTEFDKREAGGSDNHRRLYDLIWKRAIASQMSDAQIEKTVATISISTTNDTLTATGEVLIFDGFLKIYMESTDDDADTEDSKMLPPLTVGMKLPITLMKAQERFTRPPSRFTEASLVKKLEELGIGRPSTFAPTISTIQARNYVVKEDRVGRQREVRSLLMVERNIERVVEIENTGAERSKLFPTDIGSVVTDFLKEHFTEILDYNFTATVEKQFDEIAAGGMRWTTMISEFYGPFKETLEKTSETALRQSGERLLGVDPKSGKSVYVRLARYGPIAQIGDADDEEKKQKGLLSTQSIETISLEEAMELFKFPRVLDDLDGKPMMVKVGRFGPYVEHDGTFASIPKEEDPLNVNSIRAEELVLEKRKSIAERTIKEFDVEPPVKVLKGRWGPFIAVGKLNVKIPKGTDPESLTLDQCLELAAQQPATTGRGKKAKPVSAAKKTVTKKTVKKVVKKAAKKTTKKAVKKIVKKTSTPTAALEDKKSE